jgi:hypothetical protein
MDALIQYLLVYYYYYYITINERPTLFSTPQVTKTSDRRIIAVNVGEVIVA